MQPLKIAVLISGSGSNLQTLIDYSKKEDFGGKIEIVISNRKNAFGLERAKKENIKTEHISIKDYPIVEEFDFKLLEVLQKNEIDLVVLAGYLRVISGSVIKKYKNRIINIHPSLLPAFGGEGYYGLNVHQAVIERGCKISGATVHFVDEGTDTGPIILQESIYVGYDWDAQKLQQEVLKVEHNILPKAVKLYCNKQLEINKSRVIVKEKK